MKTTLRGVNAKKPFFVSEERLEKQNGWDMPAGEYELITKGVLFPDPEICPVLHCADCGLPVALFLNSDPIELPLHPKPGVKIQLPSLVWGEDVTVVCLCCSGPDCPGHDGEETAA